jgi:hypothetical protein
MENAALAKELAADLKLRTDQSDMLTFDPLLDLTLKGVQSERLDLRFDLRLDLTPDRFLSQIKVVINYDKSVDGQFVIPILVRDRHLAEEEGVRFRCFMSININKKRTSMNREKHRGDDSIAAAAAEVRVCGG